MHRLGDFVSFFLCLLETNECPLHLLKGLHHLLGQLLAGFVHRLLVCHPSVLNTDELNDGQHSETPADDQQRPNDGLCDRADGWLEGLWVNLRRYEEEAVHISPQDADFHLGVDGVYQRYCQYPRC